MPRIQVTEEEAALIEARRQRQAPVIAWNEAIGRAIFIIKHSEPASADEQERLQQLMEVLESEKKALPQ